MQAAGQHVKSETSSVLSGGIGMMFGYIQTRTWVFIFSPHLEQNGGEPLSFPVNASLSPRMVQLELYHAKKI